MKYTILLLSLLLTSNFYASATGHTMYRDRISLTCYDKVDETGSLETGLTVDCSGNGDKDCKYSDGHIPEGRAAIIGNFEAQIQANLEIGIMAGQETTDEGSYYWQMQEGGRIITFYNID